MKEAKQKSEVSSTQGSAFVSDAFPLNLHPNDIWIADSVVLPSLVNEIVIMEWLILVVNSFFLAMAQHSFPDNFMFGVASSAYQIEGAWNEDGKGENIWDDYVHSLPDKLDGDPDTAADSYHKYKEDVKLIASMNLKHYKFSLSWSRILPTGFSDTVNDKAIEYYRNLIDELTKNDIIPMVTLYHWDLPQPIQEKGGWTNESIIRYFVDYARIAFESFKTVKFWITVHEPKQVCREGYGSGKLAPFHIDSGISDYKCAYVLLKAHAAVYHLYKKEFPDLTGKISIALDGSWSEPLRDVKLQRKAAERRNEFEFGIYANPIFNKNWPANMKQRIDQRSKDENLTCSRLPAFTEEEILGIKGTADFMALNYYGARVVEHTKEDNFSTYGYDTDMRITYGNNSSWAESADGRAIVPWSIQSFLKYIKDTYGEPEIIITGNGVADSDLIHDNMRINYIREHLTYVLKAINEDNVNVTGYTYWSLLDSFEWNQGYRSHYGLFNVDMSSADKTRKPKDAVEFYRDVAINSKIPDTTTTPGAINSEKDGTSRKPI
ncbi:hypothetical protein JTB14_029289 [Gonioctena quinquepunctata]|nr:hypothetical protein JTB14_029289 [Gonioctena quinquepunctata]